MDNPFTDEDLEGIKKQMAALGVALNEFVAGLHPFTALLSEVWMQIQDVLPEIQKEMQRLESEQKKPVRATAPFDPRLRRRKGKQSWRVE